MQIVHSQNALEFKNSATCYGKEFHFDDRPMDGARIMIKGRYPESGTATNEVCEELAYVISGTGSLASASSKYHFEEGDTLFIDKREPYFWEGDCVIYVVCTPAFYPEQHKVTK